MEKKICVQCQHELEPEALFCPHCGKRVDGKKHYDWRLVTSLSLNVLFVIAALSWGVYRFYTDYRNEKEEQLYARLDGCRDEQSFNDFLEQFPHGLHANEVRQRLERLKQEDGDWKRICNSSRKGDFASFISAYPLSVYRKNAEDAIDSLDWLEASVQNTVEAYDRYISNHAEGRFLDKVYENRDQLVKYSLTSSEKNMIQNVFNSYLWALSSDDIMALKSLMVDSVAQDAVKQMKEMNGDGHYVYRLQNEYSAMKQPAYDGSLQYRVSFNVLRQKVDDSDEQTVFHGDGLMNAQSRVLRVKLTKE